MAFSGAIKDREMDKFRNVDGNTSVGVTGSIDSYTAGLKTGGKVTVVTINSTTWTALPTTALANRRAISIQNNSGVAMKINYVDDVGYEGMEIRPNNERAYDLASNITIYGRRASGTGTINVEEIA